VIVGAAAVLIAGSATAEEGAGTPGIDMVTKARQIYIFTLDPNTSASEVNQLSAAAARVGGGQQRFTFETYFKGFSIQVSDDGLARIQEELPELGSFQRAGIYSIAQGRPDNPGGGGGGGGPGGGGGGDTEENGQTIPWGITQTVGMIDENTTNIQDCLDPSLGLTCRRIWVLDTGVDQDHPDLFINVGLSREFIDAGGIRGKNTKDDENGHGTHVAGTAAAINNSDGVVGVAAGAEVISVRVLDRLGFGFADEVVQGLNYIWTSTNPAPCANGDVVNISLGEEKALGGAVDGVVWDMAEDGCLFAIAAGNGNESANNVSPANVDHDNIFTVSAVDSSGNFASFSNYGNPPVDVAAPGVGIVSLRRKSGTDTKDGTSMSAPHVAGLLAVGGSAAVRCEGKAVGDPAEPLDGIVKLGGGECLSLTHTPSP
jgi:hypothetical protein